MMTISSVYKCDHCGGELEIFPQAKSGLRCRECWMTEGKKEPVFWKRDKDGKRVAVEVGK